MWHFTKIKLTVEAIFAKSITLSFLTVQLTRCPGQPQKVVGCQRVASRLSFRACLHSQ